MVGSPLELLPSADCADTTDSVALIHAPVVMTATVVVLVLSVVIAAEPDAEDVSLIELLLSSEFRLCSQKLGGKLSGSYWGCW